MHHKAVEKRERAGTQGATKSPVGKGNWKFHLGFQFEGGGKPRAWGTGERLRKSQERA